MSPPSIKLQGIRAPIPPGYILGRTSPGTGVVELIKIADLGKTLVVAGHGSTLGVAGRAAIPPRGAAPAGTTGIALQALYTAQHALQLSGAALSQDGEDGQDGISIPGTTGAMGIPGLQGIPGQDGEDGQDGMPGLPANFANPSAHVGLTAVNGSASTAMRSDAAPALDQGIAPTWTDAHIFSNTTASTSTTTGALTVAGGVGIVGALWVGGTVAAKILNTGTITTGLVPATVDTLLTKSLVLYDSAGNAITVYGS